MADDTPDTSPSQRHGGGDGWLTRRHGPLPTWGWIAIPVGAVAVYFLYKKYKGTSTTAATAAATTPTTGTSGGNYGQGYQGQPSAASAPYTTPTVGALAGSGYGPATPSQVVAGSDGNSYAWVSSASSLASLIGAGNAYLMVEPGQFIPVTTTNGLAAGTPIWYRTSGTTGGGAGESAPSAYGQTRSDRMAGLSGPVAQLQRVQNANRRQRATTIVTGSGAGADTATSTDAAPITNNTGGTAAPIQPNVGWDSLNSSVERGA